MGDLEVMAEPLALGKVEVIILALAVKAKGAMPTLEEIGEAALALGSPRWTKRGHPAWVQHLYQRGLAKDGRITVEGRSCLHQALFKQDLPAELVGWAKNAIGDDDV